MDALLTDINQAGLGRGLQFELFKPAAERDACRSSTPSCRSRIKVTGNYHDMGAFASDVGKLSRIVTLNDIALTRRQGQRAGHGCDRQDVPLPRRGRDREAAQGRRGQGQEGRQEMNARDLAIVAAPALGLAACGGEQHAGPAAVREGVGQPAARAHSAAARGEAVRAVHLQRLRSDRPVQAAQDRAAARPRRRPAASRPDLNRRKEPLEAYPLENLQDGRHAAAEEGDLRAGQDARQHAVPRQAAATTSGRTSAASRRSPNPRSS